MAATDDDVQRELARLEFTALRAEHDARVAKQQEISNIAVALAAALTAALALGLRAVPVGGDLLDAQVVTVAAPVFSILLLTLNLMILDHEQNIAQIQVYIAETITPRLSPDLVISQIDWVRYRARQQQGRQLASLVASALPSAKHAFCFLPATAGIIAGVVLVTGHNATQQTGVAWPVWAAIGAAVLLWLLAVIGMAYTSRIYLRLGRRPS